MCTALAARCTAQQARHGIQFFSAISTRRGARVERLCLRFLLSPVLSRNIAHTTATSHGLYRLMSKPLAAESQISLSRLNPAKRTGRKFMLTILTPRPLGRNGQNTRQNEGNASHAHFATSCAVWGFAGIDGKSASDSSLEGLASIFRQASSRKPRTEDADICDIRHIDAPAHPRRML